MRIEQRISELCFPGDHVLLLNRNTAPGSWHGCVNALKSSCVLLQLRLLKVSSVFPAPPLSCQTSCRPSEAPAPLSPSSPRAAISHTLRSLPSPRWAPLGWLDTKELCRLSLMASFVLVLQEAAATASPIHTGRQSEGDAQLRQQEELASLQQQFQQLSSDVDQIVADMKHMSVTNAQVFHTAFLLLLPTELYCVTVGFVLHHCGPSSVIHTMIHNADNITGQ